jgi:phosphohistidine phosphatase
MKQIYLVRHAKSSWNDVSVSDFDRPLNKRGQSDAPEMAQRAKSAGYIPEIIFSSPALRAKTTAEVFASTLGINEIIFVEDLYLASASEIITTLQGVPEDRSSAMLFGHNPGMTEVVNALSNSDIENVPTCGFSHITFKTTRWNDIREAGGALAHFDFPKNR